MTYDPPVLQKSPTQTATDGRAAPAWAVVLCLVAAVGFGVLVWEDGLKDRVTYKNLGEVEPGLWRSGQISQFAIGPALRSIRPTLIVSLSEDNPLNADNMAEKGAAETLGIRRVHVQLSGDGTGDPEEYVKALAAVIEEHERGGVVLVHCSAGSERTSGVAALYRTLYQGRPAAEAVREMPEYKHDLEEGVLVDYLNENVAHIAQRLASGEYGVIDRVPDPLPRFERP